MHADPNMSNPAPRMAVHALLRPGAGSGALPAAAAVLLILIGFPQPSVADYGDIYHFEMSLLRRHRARMAPGRLKTART